MRKYVYAVIVSIAWIASGVSFAQSLGFGTVERPDAKTIRITGILGPPVETAFREALSDQVQVVIITSEGGVTESALAIAELIQSRGLNVVVRGYCLSSCANYIFIAGKSKDVEKDSLVGWHGGHSFTPIRPGDSEAAVRERFVLLRREQMLYLRAAASLDLVIYSGLVTMGKMESSSQSTADREYSLWCPDRTELERLGVTGIRSFWFPDEGFSLELLRRHGLDRARIFRGRAYSYIPKVLIDYRP